MFKKEQVIGEGTYGTVYLVKALVTSILTHDASAGSRILMNDTD